MRTLPAWLDPPFIAGAKLPPALSEPMGLRESKGGSYASEASALTQAAAVSMTSTKAGSCFVFPPGTLNE